MNTRLKAMAERLHRALVPAAIVLLLIIMLARATRPTAAVQPGAEGNIAHHGNDLNVSGISDLSLAGPRALFQSAQPTPTPTLIPLTPTPTPIPPTPTPTPIPPTPTPTPVPPLSIGELMAVDPPTGIVEKDVEISFAVVFTDPAYSAHSAQWYWGDGTSSSQPDVDSPVENSHAYGQAGIYVVDVMITNSAGQSASSTYESLVVYDASDGFVTGGGWIDSPAGAYAYDPSVTGKATFAFVSKYTRGRQTPTGHTEFRFNAAGFRFSSANYYWLVVKGNEEALFSGSGTINGQLAPNGDPFKFKVWANDDEPDTFRIRIWWEDFDASEHVIYDNGQAQSIGGGSIVIHSGKDK